MFYAKYRITDEDQFNPFDFPNLELEMTAIQTMVNARPAGFDIDKFLFFLKTDERMSTREQKDAAKTVWIGFPEMPVEHLRGLFASSSNNPGFRKQLESYVRMKCGSAT